MTRWRGEGGGTIGMKVWREVRARVLVISLQSTESKCEILERVNTRRPAVQLCSASNLHAVAPHPPLGAPTTGAHIQGRLRGRCNGQAVSQTLTLRKKRLAKP
eukprot:364723-Chlamydomonas_euryale.AAC.6